MPTLRIKITSKEQLDHIFKAEKELSLAGVTFDTGTNIGDDEKPTTRDWELDWSIKGAEIIRDIPFSSEEVEGIKKEVE